MEVFSIAVYWKLLFVFTCKHYNQDIYSLGEGARDTAQVTPLEAGDCHTRCGSGDARDGTPTSMYATF